MGFMKGKNVENWDPSFLIAIDEGFKKFIKKLEKQIVNDS